MRKISNCKSRRLTPEILNLYATTELSPYQIGKKIGLSGETVKNIGKKYNITPKRLERKSTYKTTRNKKIIKDIQKGKTYKEIGKKYNITKQRVAQFAKHHNIYRWEENREYRKKIISLIKEDIKQGRSYDAIMSKYADKYNNIKTILEGGLFTYIKEKRNKKIVNQYKCNTAQSITVDTSPLLDTPQRIGSVNMIYQISNKNGYKKYPKIGNRRKGGLFESSRVINLIKELKKENYTYREIAEELNNKGWKSPMGKIYTTGNVYNKHKSIIKHNL